MLMAIAFGVVWERLVFATVAVTLTEVCTVPASTKVAAWPLLPVTAVDGLSVMPPAVVLGEKSTVASGTGLPVASFTWKMTLEEVLPPTP